MSTGDLEEAIRILEDELNLGSGFLIKLWREPDAWSFAIKAHALLESALSDLLRKYLLHKKLETPVAALPLNGKAGKVAFLRALGLITAEEENFLNEFSSLRNTLVHNVHNVRFDFQTFLATDPQKAKRLGAAAAGVGATGAVKQKYEKNFLSNPQLSIWWAVLFVTSKAQSALLKSSTARKRLQDRVKKLHGLTN